MSRAIDGDKLFEFIQKEKAWKQFTIQRPRYDKGKQDAYYEMLEIIQEQPTMQLGNWIPVSERLPDKHTDVLVIIKENELQIAYYEPIEGWHLTYNNYLFSRNPIAWQPLPEPYKEEQ